MTLSDCQMQGRIAHTDGAPRSACPYRREDLSAAWESGWLLAERDAADRANPLTADERRRGRAALAQLREVLAAA